MLGDKAELMSLKEASKQIDSGKYGFPSLENSTVEVNSERSTYENLVYSGMKYLERNIKTLSYSVSLHASMKKRSAPMFSVQLHQ